MAMAENYPYRSPQKQQHQMASQPLAHRVVKTVGAATAGGSMMLLSGLTWVGTIIGLTVVTPLLVIFSPVLVPAGIAVFLITLGFLSSGGFGLVALSMVVWVYSYVTEKDPPGAVKLDHLSPLDYASNFWCF